MNRRIEIFRGGKAVDRFSSPDWYWRVKAPNGRIVAVGGEGYRERGDAIEAVLRELRLRKPSRMRGTRALVEVDEGVARILATWERGRITYAQFRLDNGDFYDLVEVAR